MPKDDFRDEELLADVICQLIGNVRHVAVGVSSPIPATAALLARERGGGRPYVSLLGSRAHTFFTDGSRELFDCAGQGRVDVFFLSGGRIDREGNINLVTIGDYEHPKVRFPGSFGSAYLYCLRAPRRRDSAGRQRRPRPGRGGPRNRRRQRARWCRSHRRFLKIELNIFVAAADGHGR